MSTYVSSWGSATVRKDPASKHLWSVHMRDSTDMSSLVSNWWGSAVPQSFRSSGT